MKWLRGLGVVLGVALVLGFAARNMLLKGQLEKLVSAQTGFAFTVERVQVGWNLSSVDLIGARVRNPPDFPDAQALDIRQARVSVAPLSLLTREIVIREVILDVEKLVLVRKADGETNAERLGGKRKGGGGRPGGSPPEPAPEPEPTPREPAEPRGFRIDRLVLKVGAVEMHDFTKAQRGRGAGGDLHEFESGAGTSRRDQRAAAGRVGPGLGRPANGAFPDRPGVAGWGQQAKPEDSERRRTSFQKKDEPAVRHAAGVNNHVQFLSCSGQKQRDAQEGSGTHPE
jgi:uncharacterized protein involved in outer membrane biogenesis